MRGRGQGRGEGTPQPGALGQPWHRTLRCRVLWGGGLSWEPPGERERGLPLPSAGDCPGRGQRGLGGLGELAVAGDEDLEQPALRTWGATDMRPAADITVKPLPCSVPSHWPWLLWLLAFRVPALVGPPWQPPALGQQCARFGEWGGWVGAEEGKAVPKGPGGIWGAATLEASPLGSGAAHMGPAALLGPTGSQSKQSQGCLE